jgi:adenylate cyclase
MADVTLPLGTVKKISVPRSRLSLGVRWSVAVAVLVATTMGLLGWIAMDQQQRAFARQLDLFGKSMAAQLAGSAGEPLLADDRLALRLLIAQMPHDAGLRGTAILGRGRPMIGQGIVPPAPRAAPQGDVLDWTWTGADGTVHRARTYWAPVRFGGLDAGLALVTLDADVLAQGLRSAISGTLLASLLLIPLAVGAAVLLARRLTRPLQALASLSGDLERGTPLDIPPAEGRSELDHIVQSFNRLAASIREKDRLETLLNRCVPLPLTRHLPQDPALPGLHAVNLEGSVLFCDVTGFTALSEPLPPDEVVYLLNEYFLYITSAAHSCGGVVDSFSGDSVMVVFADDADDPLHGLHAATCALLIRDTVARLNQCREARGERVVRFRIGVNSGPMALCYLGGEERIQPTVIGDAVNVAARLCGLGHPGEVTLGEGTAQAPEVAIRLRLTPLPVQPLRGRHEQMGPYRAEALADTHHSQLQEILERILPRGTA